ncbi:MAG: hypothetical protein N2662_06860 [Bacteroidales bacterium]|nr:hypothetical protein [Bacteroidales bacterium]
MNILVVASSEKEIKFVLEQEVAVFLPGENVYSVSRGENTVEFLITGPGMVHATHWVTRILCNKKYDLVVHVGLAGSFRNNIRVGSVVNVETDFFADLGFSEKGSVKSFFEVGVIDRNTFPFRDGGLKYTFDISGFRLLKTLPKVNAITVSHNTSEPADMAKKIDKYNPDIETLDGAAVLLCCLIYNIPCISIRAVSYQVESFTFRSWQLPEVLFSLGKHLFFLINELMQRRS